MEAVRDKYEELLREAVEKAGIITKDVEWRMPAFKYVGTVQKSYGGNYHYYYDEGEDKFYYESDFDREMRAILRRNKRKFNAKN